MKTKKYSLKSLQQAAINTIEKYTGIIPDWSLDISARVETDFKSEKVKYAIIYDHKNTELCDLAICSFGHNPAKVIDDFNRQFRELLGLDDQFEDITL